MKKKKRKVLSKKEKLIIIGVAIVVFLVILAIAMSFTRQNVQQNTTEITDLNQELTTVQEVVDYLESTYISMSDSSAEGYDLDIYVSFKYNLYEGDESKELYFTNMYEKIAMVTNFNSFRIIDSNKNLTIEVKCSSSGISEVKINGELEYFKNEASRRSRENELNVETIELEIDSEVLQNLINANWIANNVDLGTQESTFYKYRIYFDEGYEVRVIGQKVFNIVFTEKYGNRVVSKFKPGDDLETIESALGTSYKDTGIIGYKTKDFYIFFSSDEISIYPIYRYDYTEFEELVKKYNEEKDINNLMYKLTDIWTDYDQYTYESNYFEIWYTLKGVKIEYNANNPEGIQIYENYRGDLKNEQTYYLNLYYKLNKNLILEKEKLRIMAKVEYDNSEISIDPIHYSNKFGLRLEYSGTGETITRIISLDGDYPNNEFDDTIAINTYIWTDDSHLIYSIIHQGIYMYNAETRETETLLTGKNEYNITNYDRDKGILEYDGNMAKIDF